MNKKCSAHLRLIFEQPLNFEFRHVLSGFGRGDTRVCGSFIVSITDTYNKIAKFILMSNAIYGTIKL